MIPIQTVAYLVAILAMVAILGNAEEIRVAGSHPVVKRSALTELWNQFLQEQNFGRRRDYGNKYQPVSHGGSPACNSASFTPGPHGGNCYTTCNGDHPKCPTKYIWNHGLIGCNGANENCCGCTYDTRTARTFHGA